MSVRMIITALLTGAALATAAGCGADEQAARERERAAQDAREDRARERKQAAEKAAKAERAREAAAACDAQLGALVDALGELDSRLDIGLNYDEYTDQVADVKVVYDQIDYDSGGSGEDAFECISSVGLPSEKALNGYIKAAGVWGDCFDDFDCVTDSIEPELQGHWTKAGNQTHRARRALRKLKTAAS